MENGHGHLEDGTGHQAVGMKGSREVSEGEKQGQGREKTSKEKFFFFSVLARNEFGSGMMFQPIRVVYNLVHKMSKLFKPSHVYSTVKTVYSQRFK